MVVVFFSIIAILAGICAGYILKARNLHIWMASYLKFCLLSWFRVKPELPVHILFCFVDHFEPGWNRPDMNVERRRVTEWLSRYPIIADKYRDADGKPPQHTFFYPQEEYRPEHLERLKELVDRGYGEVEIHLHHDNDTAEGLRHKIEDFKINLRSHDLLKNNFEGDKLRFGFIHGNWALDNSRKDGRMCGVNNELIVLKEAGCYADFTFPSAPHETQPKKINSIYYATDDPVKPKSHNSGIDIQVNGKPVGDLMLMQGPLTLNWKKLKWRLLPKIENGEIAFGNPPSQDRVDLWIKQGVSVKGRREWIFVKIHTHGTQEKNMQVVLDKPIEKMHAYLAHKYNDGKCYVLHYVTAREMYNIIKAAENGRSGNPNAYRDYVLKAKNA